MSAPRASTLGVVVPALDEAAALPRLLARLLDAAPPDGADQVVVVDGGSGDGTPDLARAAGARVLETARGRGVQVAAGGRALDTELLWFLHADCLPEPGALAALREAFGDPGLQVAGCAQRIDASGVFYRLVERAADRRVRRGMVYGDSGLCVRRAAYEAVGGFGELPLFEDVDLCLRLRERFETRLVPAARLAISARRWEREGRLRATLRNWMLRTAYACGVDPRRLARSYAPHSVDGTRGRDEERSP